MFPNETYFSCILPYFNCISIWHNLNVFYWPRVETIDRHNFEISTRKNIIKYRSCKNDGLIAKSNNKGKLIFKEDKLPMKKALILGFLSFVPALIFMGAYFQFIPQSWLAAKINILSFGTIHIWTWIMYLSVLVLGIIYIYHVCRNANLGLVGKIVWALVLFNFNLLVFPIYWYFYLLRPARNKG